LDRVGTEPLGAFFVGGFAKAPALVSLLCFRRHCRSAGEVTGLYLEVSPSQRSRRPMTRSGNDTSCFPPGKTTILTIFIVSLIVCGSTLAGQTSVVSDAAAPPPTRQFDLSQLGFQQLSEMARRSGASNLSLDFLDRDHVLFTFNPKKLFTRHPDCPATHDDRIVHAAILEISSGTVLKEMEWYVHDSRRYLWTLGTGKILLRKLNSLYIVGADLQETPLWTSSKDLLWMSVTPDGKQIITETAADAASSPSKAKQASKKLRVQITFRDAESLAVQRVIQSEKTANVDAASSGFASVIPGATGRVWLVRFGPDGKQRANIARVRTRRAPDVLYLSSNTLLIGRDSSSRPGYSVSVFTVTGNRLWRQHWDRHRYFPVLARSEDGSRFAISTFRLVDAPTSASADEQLHSQQEGLEQRIEVFNTASGTPVRSATAAPSMLNGQNFSLSPDGLRLAVLRGTQIEFYELPEMSSEEQAKYSAAKADVPGLYIPPADTEQSEANGTAFTAADDEATASADSSNPPTAPPGSSSAALSQVPPPPSASLPADGNSPTSSMITLKSRTQVVALDVVVTDPKSGHTVKGLPREDFQVREDGKPQTITYFDEVEPRPAPPVRQQKEVAADIFTNDSPTPGSESVTLILYDLLNTPADEQQRAKLELLKFLQNKPKSTRFALCALSDTLQMVQGFTADEDRLVKAVKGQEGSLRYTSMQNQDMQDQQTISWLTQGAAKLVSRGAARFGPIAQNMQDMGGRLEQDKSQRHGRDLDMRALLTMDAFAQLARYLAAIPGRKSLIWLSGSFPLGIFPGVDLRNSDLSTDSSTEQVKQAVNLLAESHIAVYPVDVRGLSAYSMQTPTFSNAPDSTQPSSASQSPYSPTSDTKRLDELGNLSAAGDIGANLPGGNSPFMQEMTDHGIMDRIAAETGGKAFYNTNGIEQAMAVVLEQERNYYALSYTPSNKKYDGKFRKIKVSLAPIDKKLHVDHRSGYFAADPNAGEFAKDAAKGFGLVAMQHGSPQAHQIFFAARVIPLGKPRQVDPTAAGIVLPVSKKKKHHEQDARPAEPVEMQRYVVDYAVTPNQLRFDATPQGIRHGVINFMITSFDENGTLRTSIVSRASRDLKPENYQEIQVGGLRLRQQVDVPLQAASMRLGVQDVLTGHMGTVEIPLPVNAPPGVEQSLAHVMPEIEPD
jgi:VWFA-related protein